jgi:hypothetical protein
MLDPKNIPPVEDDEFLARYVTQRGQFRPSDKQVKQSLFLPHPRQELSVTRHLEATEAEIWSAGNDVSRALARELYGRADIQAGACKLEMLRVVAKPILNNPKIPDNPNHADIEGWPEAKADQKAIALKLAASATKLIPPPSILA